MAKNQTENKTVTSLPTPPQLLSPTCWPYEKLLLIKNEPNRGNAWALYCTLDANRAIHNANGNEERSHVTIVWGDYRTDWSIEKQNSLFQMPLHWRVNPRDFKMKQGRGQRTALDRTGLDHRGRTLPARCCRYCFRFVCIRFNRSRRKRDSVDIRTDRSPQRHTHTRPHRQPRPNVETHDTHALTRPHKHGDIKTAKLGKKDMQGSVQWNR